ncbi:MAG: hypothetical protein HC848_10265 [Limnobacter sp.]|nr:hypothetical protein [Limnobacter sp.]
METLYNQMLSDKAAVSLSEIEQLVSIARRQLLVLGNIQGASVALNQAVELLEQTDDPGLLQVKVAIEKDLAELNALPEVDIIKTAISLDSVINSVDILPTLADRDVQTDTTLAELGHEKSAQTPEAPRTIEPIAHNANVWQAMKSAVFVFFSTAWEDIKGLVEITHIDHPEALMISGQQAQDLRNALRLSLLNARLSLLSRHGELLASDLKRSRSLLLTYFDPRNAQVARAVSLLENIGSMQVSITPPELQNSTSAIRLFKAGQRSKS